jgi:hypothetical protein
MARTIIVLALFIALALCASAQEPAKLTDQKVPERPLEIAPCRAGEGDVGEVVHQSLCEDDSTIYTQLECEYFARALGVKYKWGGTFNSRWEPRGCFVSSTNYLFINSFKERTGNPCGFSSTRCLCKTGCEECKENTFSTDDDLFCIRCEDQNKERPSTIAVKGAISKDQCHERSWKSKSLRGSFPKWRRLI